MSHEVIDQKQVARVVPETRPQERLDAVVESVRRDAQQDSQNYLLETKVPHGGE